MTALQEKKILKNKNLVKPEKKLRWKRKVLAFEKKKIREFVLVGKNGKKFIKSKKNE